MDFTQYLDPDIIGKLQAGGYVLMLGLMILEGPLITMIAAFLASMGIFDIYIVALLGWLGDLIADILFFSIGRFGLHIFQKKTTVDTPSEKGFIHKLDTLIHKNLILALLIIKFTPYAPPIGLTYIGRSKIHTRRYISALLMTCIPIPLAATLLGYHIGYITNLFRQYPLEKVIIYASGGLIAMILLGIGLWYMYKKSQSILGDDGHIIPYRDEKSTRADTRASK